MHRPSTVVTLALALATALASGGGGASAQAGANSPESPACRQALASLEAQESTALARPGGPLQPASPSSRADTAAAVQAARQQAAHACLGGRGNTPLPVQRLAQPPLTVAPIGAPRAAVPLAVQPVMPSGAPTLPLPPIRQNPPPAVVTSCDPGGCWASDGTRLTRAGPNLMGPRGFCTLHGALLNCP